MRTLLSARASQCERARKNAGVDGRTSGAFRPAPLEVRWGRTGETLTLLNGQTITLDTNTRVIADPHAAQSLAGIMGGAHTAVSLDTRHIRVEMAFWHPDAIRGRARRYNVSSEAAHR